MRGKSKVGEVGDFNNIIAVGKSVRPAKMLLLSNAPSWKLASLKNSFKFLPGLKGDVNTKKVSL